MGQAGDTRLRILGLDGDRAEEALRKIQQAAPPPPASFSTDSAQGADP